MPRKKPSHVVVITGASSALGQALALEFALHGDAVVLAAMSEELLEKPRRSCETLGALTHGCIVPDRNLQAMQSMAQSAMDRFGRIDIWINHAAPFDRSGNAEDADFALTAEMANFDQSARTAMIVFRAQKRGVLINVDGYANMCSVSDGALAAVRAQFAAIERGAASVPGLVTHSITTTHGISWQELAGRVARLAHSEARGDVIGRAAALLTRQQMRLWSAGKAARHRLGRKDAASRGVLMKRESGRSRRASKRDGEGHRRRGVWHVAYTKDGTERTAALMALVALSLVMAAVMLALVA